MHDAQASLVDSPDYALAFRSREPLPASPKRLLVLLHGVGCDETQLASLGDGVDADTVVASPRAPRSLGGDMLGWFHEAVRDDRADVDGDEERESRARLVALLAQLQEKHGIAPRDTVVAGFSQGGMLAASAALTSPRSVGGFAMLSARIVPAIEIEIARDDVRGLRALVVHGRDDETLPMDCAMRTHELLDALGIAHDVRLHDAGHVLVPGMRDDFLAWHAAGAACVRPAW